jgi:pimeloyl-ACP methyl ester carboxylesterase
MSFKVPDVRGITAAVVAGVAGAAGGVTGWRSHLKAIADDPFGVDLTLKPGRSIAVASADGTRLHAEVFGPEDAPTVVLAHGWIESITYWVFQIRDLARDYRVVAYDQRGHGHSGSAAHGDYSLERVYEDLEAVLLACVSAGERPVVIGHSLGAMALVGWAREHDVDRRISGAVLVNAGVGSLVAEGKIFPAPELLDRLFRGFVGRSVFLGNPLPIPKFKSPIHHAIATHLAFGPDPSPAQVQYLLDSLFATNVRARAAIGLAMADMEIDEAVPRLTVPTLLIAGEHDPMTPVVHSERMCANLPLPVGLKVVPGTGHMTPIERPAELNAALRRFLADYPPGRSSHSPSP